MHWNPAVGIPLIIIGLIVLALIWLFGQPRRPWQGRRTRSLRAGARREPTLNAAADTADVAPTVVVRARSGTPPEQGELDVDGHAAQEPARAGLAAERPDALARAAAPAAGAPEAIAAAHAADHLGKRPSGSPVERIVSLFVVAPEGHTFHGSDLVVAMEKAGLEFGALHIFHRLLDGKPEQGAVFSVANMVKPGSFDMASLEDLQTPGLSFFMTLPGPLSALDAWDTMLPTAQRLAKLLEGQVLDEERNGLGRQRIAYIRDDLRRWDRRHEVT